MSMSPPMGSVFAPPPPSAPAAPEPGPAVQALQRASDPGTAEGWEATSTPGLTRPGLGDRLPVNRTPLFTGRIY